LWRGLSAHSILVKPFTQLSVTSFVSTRQSFGPLPEASYDAHTGTLRELYDQAIQVRLGKEIHLAE